jgi:hypothetical protein
MKVVRVIATMVQRLEASLPNLESWGTQFAKEALVPLHEHDVH